MPALTAVLTSDLANPTYNVGIANTFSWVPLSGLDRTLYGQAIYLANTSLTAQVTQSNIKINTEITLAKCVDIINNLNNIISNNTWPS
jgi:hypothetical protein